MPLIWQMRRKVKKYYLLVLRKVNSNKSIVKGQVIVSFAIRSCITEKNEIVEVYLWKKTFSQGGNSLLLALENIYELQFSMFVVILHL